MILPKELKSLEDLIAYANECNWRLTKINDSIGGGTPLVFYHFITQNGNNISFIIRSDNAIKW